MSGNMKFIDRALVRRGTRRSRGRTSGEKRTRGTRKTTPYPKSERMEFSGVNGSVRGASAGDVTFAPLGELPCGAVLCAKTELPVANPMDSIEMRKMAICGQRVASFIALALRGLTFDMSGGRKQAEPAGGRPLDGVVRPHALRRVEVHDRF